MTMFTDTTMQLKKDFADHLVSLKGPSLEIKQDDLLLLIQSPDVSVVLEAL